MADRHLPFMSIVVNCYNGEATIARTLDSLVVQDYPRDRFEIIVIDDGSTDDTGKIVSKYKDVRCVRLPKNLGVSGARNAGLEVVKGDIFVGCDDDCVVKPNWLSVLAQGYETDNPVGVCGYMDELGPLQGLVKQYVGTLGKGFPPVVDTEQHTIAPLSPLRRLYRYLAGGLHLLDEQTVTRAEVSELYGANGSYPVAVLKAVGGWHKGMSGIEDRDLSLRIHKQFPDRHFYAMRNAIMMHDPAMPLKKFLLRPYNRGPVTLQFHRQNGILPPFFPYPILLLAILVSVACMNYILLPLALVLVPQVLYFWWTYYACKERKLTYFMFPYLQLAEEMMVSIGLVRGYILSFKEAHGAR